MGARTLSSIVMRRKQWIWVGRSDGGKMGEFPFETFGFFCDLRVKVIGE